MSKQELLEHTASRIFAGLVQDANTVTPDGHIEHAAQWSWEKAAIFTALRPEPEQQPDKKKRKGRR